MRFERENTIAFGWSIYASVEKRIAMITTCNFYCCLSSKVLAYNFANSLNTGRWAFTIVNSAAIVTTTKQSQLAALIANYVIISRDRKFFGRNVCPFLPVIRHWILHLPVMRGRGFLEMSRCVTARLGSSRSLNAFSSATYPPHPPIIYEWIFTLVYLVWRPRS